MVPVGTLGHCNVGWHRTIESVQRKEPKPQETDVIFVQQLHSQHPRNITIDRGKQTKPNVPSILYSALPSSCALLFSSLLFPGFSACYLLYSFLLLYLLHSTLLSPLLFSLVFSTLLFSTPLFSLFSSHAPLLCSPMLFSPVYSTLLYSHFLYIRFSLLNSSLHSSLLPFLLSGFYSSSLHFFTLQTFLSSSNFFLSPPLLTSCLLTASLTLDLHHLHLYGATQKCLGKLQNSANH